jgi:hypothetical protein
MDDSVLSSQASRTWHIYWQAAVGRDLVQDPALVNRIRSRVLEAHQQSGRELLYYLLTSTEIHLVTVLAPGESAGDLARGVANVVARWVRDIQGTPGPVFIGPYQARRIENLEALRGDLRMLAWRPVSLNLAVAATHYPHSALRIALGLSRGQGFHAGALLRSFGDTVLEARHVLRAVLAKRPSALEILQWELALGLTLAPGLIGPMGRMSRQVRGVAAALVAASESKCIDGALDLLERWIEVKLGLHATHGLAGLKGIQGARGRALVANIAVRSNLCSASSVARHFGRAKATLSEQMTASRRRPADQQILAIPMEQVVREAVALAMCPSTGKTTYRVL